MKKSKQAIQATKKPLIGAAEVVLLAALILSGGFHEFISCAISVLAAVFLTIRIIRTKRVILRLNPVSGAAALIVLGYLVTPLYAVDTGMAFVGFVRALPILLFLLLLMQDESERDRIIERLPLYAAGIGLISLILMYLPIATEYFSVEGRLAGTFQYPNAFAMFLLVSELILIGRERLRIWDILTAAVLIFLLIWTGSRAVFVLALVSNAVMLFTRKGRRIKIITAASAAALVIAALALYPALKDSAVVGRFFALSLSESTFAGRLLYWQDALPVVLRHPFGLGYMGYYYIEQSIQTGVYAVKFVHNDLLQLMLDVGWLPCLGFLAAFVMSLCSRRLSLRYKVILSAMLLHALFDMDLQFTAMVCLMLLFCDLEGGRRKELKNGSATTMVAVIALGLTSLYFSFALGFEYFGNTSACDAMYPADTQNRINMLIETDDVEQQDQIADTIIAQNPYVQLAYDAKALYAYSQGDIEQMITYKRRVLEIAPFAYDEYEDYCYKLIEGAQSYAAYGDLESARLCKEELTEVVRQLGSLNDRLSYLGSIIVDQPVTELPADIQAFIDSDLF